MYRPWVGRKFGVEMEMNRVNTSGGSLTQESIVIAAQQGVRAAGVTRSVRRMGYEHSNGTTWDVKTDASCGWELAAPALTLDESGNNAELKAVMNAVAALRPQINKSCGLHVHVEVRDFNARDLRNLIVLWARYEPYFFELCPPSRRSNTFCVPHRKTTWGAADHNGWNRIEPALAISTDAEFRRALAAATSRYNALNLTHFWNAQRIEFRLAAGTIDYEKVSRWVQLLLTLVQRVKQANMPMIQSGGWSNKGFSTMYVAKMLGLAESAAVPATEIPSESAVLVQWMEARRQKFIAAARQVAAGAAAGRSVQPF